MSIRPMAVIGRFRMFFNKKSDPRPLGIPLDDLVTALAATTLKVKREDDSLIVKHRTYSTRVDVIRPPNLETENGPIKAVIQIRSVLPQEVAAMFKKPELTVAMNAMASLGALTVDDEMIFVGSRLTMYEDERAWNIQFPLLLFAIIGSTDSLIGAMRRMFGRERGERTASAWTENDFKQVEGSLSKVSVCNAGECGLTAEFSLRDGAVSAADGDHHTALWQLIGDQPHPDLGGGLFCLLQMPHTVADETRLNRVVMQLNKMEMAAHDLPPHFGAWCRGKMDNNPAYVSFLPNARHSTAGIAANTSIWALNRAQWANAMLASMGIRT